MFGHRAEVESRIFFSHIEFTAKWMVESYSIVTFNSKLDKSRGSDICRDTDNMIDSNTLEDCLEWLSGLLFYNDFIACFI